MRLRALTSLATLALTATSLGLAIAPAQATTNTTSISWNTPLTARIGVYNTLTVSVGSADGVTQPIGGVQFTNADGQIIGSAATSRGGSVSDATASIVWVPTQETTYTFKATYYPQSGSGLASSTTSTPITITATPSGQNVMLAVTQMYQGIPTTMSATVFPTTLLGSVGFTANGYGVGASIPIVNAAASLTFTPGSLGWQEFGVSFTATNAPGTQGAVSQWVNVLRPLGTDDITLSPTPTTMVNGASVTLVATTIAGAAASLGATGPCSLAGSVLTATAGSGTCTVTGTSPSTGGYLGTQESWAIALTPGAQTATITARASGPVKVGRTVTLGAATAATSAGKRITWRITSGSAVCSLTSVAGSVRLRMDAVGTCRVRASAPAVAGQWQAFTVGRVYTAK